MQFPPLSQNNLSHYQSSKKSEKPFNADEIFLKFAIQKYDEFSNSKKMIYNKFLFFLRRPAEKGKPAFCRPGQAYLAQECKISVRQVKRIIKSFKDDGLITIKRTNRRKFNNYFINKVILESGIARSPSWSPEINEKMPDFPEDVTSNVPSIYTISTLSLIYPKYRHCGNVHNFGIGIESKFQKFGLDDACKKYLSRQSESVIARTLESLQFAEQKILKRRQKVLNYSKLCMACCVVEKNRRLHC